MKNIHEQQGSTLLLTLILILLLIIFITIIITYQTKQYKQAKKFQFSLQIDHNIESTLFTLMDSLMNWPMLEMENQMLQLPWDDTCIVTLSDFGFFKKAKISSSIRDVAHKSQFLLGKMPGSIYQTALYIADDRTPLTLTGEIDITGNIATGIQGIQKKSFKGQKFRGSFIGENVLIPDLTLPEFDDESIDGQISKWEHIRLNPRDFEYFDHLKRGEKTNNQKIVYSEKSITLNNEYQFLSTENATIVSKKVITVSEKFDIAFGMKFIADDIILKDKVVGKPAIFYAANSISVEDSVACSGQFFAIQKIELKDSSILTYPSILYLAGLELKGERNGDIIINDFANIQGTILYLPSESIQLHEKGYLRVGNNCLVEGLIYHANRVDFHGLLHGTLVAQNTYFYDAPTHYINWLKDGEISVFKRRQYYCLPTIFKDFTGYGVSYYENIE